MEKVLLGTAIALALSTTAAAANDVMLAQKVYDNCLSTDTWCTFYPAGVWDGIVEAHDAAIWGLDATKTKTQDWLCDPDNVQDKMSLNDERKIFIQYIHKHPDKLKYAAGDIVAEAFAAAFPCNEYQRFRATE